MNKLFALLLIIFVSYSFEDRMRCFDDLDGSPTEKCYVEDKFNDLQYYDSCKNGKVCTLASPIEVPNSPSFNIDDAEGANYGVCAPVPFGGFEGSVCGDNAECFSNNCDGTKCGEPAEFCKMHSECEKGKYCNIFTQGTQQPTYKCTGLVNSGGDCYDDSMCLPLHLCNLATNPGKCQKIGSVVGEKVSNNLLCKTGFAKKDVPNDDDDIIRTCIQTAEVDCVNKAVSGTATYDDGTKETGSFSFGCRKSLLDNSYVPKVSKNSIEAFNDYVNAINKDVDLEIDEKHANYGYIRYHYDKKKS